MVELTCPYDNGKALLKSSTEIYGKDYGLVYVCENYPKCDAYVGCHKGTDRPLGRLANKELRQWKMKTHEAVDPLWQSGMMKREEVYSLIAMLLQIPKEQAHIGMFDVETCKKLIQKLGKYQLLLGEEV